MDRALSDLRDSFANGDLDTQHNLIVKIENWSRVRIDAENAQKINDCLYNVLPIYYSHSFHECPLCRSDNYMTWTSLLASFLDSKVLLQKHNSHNNSDLFNSKDLCMVEFTLSGETIYLVDVLLQMNTTALVPEFGEFVAKRIFSLDKSTYKRHEIAIRILMLHKWLDLNFSHVLKPTYEQLGRYLDPNSVLDWMGLRIRTNIKKKHWRGCTVADKIRILLKSFDLSTLAALLGQSTTSDGGEQCKKQNIYHHRGTKEHIREKKMGRKLYSSALQIGGDARIDIVKELNKEGNQSSLYSLEEPKNPSSPNPQQDRDITPEAKPRLADRNDRKRKMSDREAKVQTDYGFSTSSKRTKLNGECSDIDNTNVLEVANDIDTNQNIQDDVSADTSLHGKPVITMEWSQNVGSPSKRKTPKKNRTSTVSVKNVIVSPTASAEKRRVSRSDTNTRSETDMLKAASDIDTNQNIQDDVSADTSLHGKPVITMEWNQDVGSPSKRKTPKKNRTSTVSVKNVIVSPTASAEKRRVSRSDTNTRSETDVFKAASDIDTNQNIQDDVSADTSLHGKPVITMEWNQDVGSPSKQKTPKKDKTSTIPDELSADRSATVNNVATLLDTSASLSSVELRNNICTSGKLSINSGLNKPVTRKSKTTDAADCKSDTVRSRYSLRTRNSLR
uniref:ULP_PROTEASE domain-containing protein n=1 Tax=Schistosoma mansoni TaxID=6183 RepID=A0A5K4EHZ1_SCHMA